MEGYDFLEQRMSLPDFIKMGIKTFQGGPLQPFLSYSKWCSYCGEAHALENCSKLNFTNQAPSPQYYQQSPQECGVNLNQEVPHEDTFQAFEPQAPWCAICGGSHALESCYLMAPIHQVPHQYDQQQASEYNVNFNQEALQEGAPPMSMPQPLWCAICGGPHEAERCYIFDSNFQYQGQVQEPPQQEPQQQYQDQFHEVSYQEPQQECQPLDQDLEMKSMMANMLMQMNELQAQLDNMKAQGQGLTTQEPAQELSSNREVLQELLLLNEGLVVDGHENEGEDFEDEDAEVHDECIELEIPSWGESVDMQIDGNEEQLGDGPIERVFNKDEIDEICGTDKEYPSLDEHSFLNHEVVKMSLREFIEGCHLECFLEERVGEKENMIEEESIFLEVDTCKFFEKNMLLLSLKEFLNARHLRTFIEEKVDGEKGLIFIHSCMDSSLRG